MLNLMVLAVSFCVPSYHERMQGKWEIDFSTLFCLLNSTLKKKRKVDRGGCKKIMRFLANIFLLFCAEGLWS
jgi:hypothetical protein